MKGDFSRVTFDPAKHFSQVLMQQGRVTLDADHNEQAAIFLHLLRTLTRDLYSGPNGSFGGPAGSTGFLPNLTPATGGGAGSVLNINAGHYYVDGILCETEGCSYAAQPEYTPDASDPLLKWLTNPGPGFTVFWIYLDVWERHITWIEDDSLREVALGGPDTCTRSKVVWQVKAKVVDQSATCWSPLQSLVQSDEAMLAAQIDPGLKLGDPCVISPDSKYRGAENQLYRVEIHQGGKVADGATFKWSRDNGSVVTPWLGTEGNDLIVASTRGFDAGTWVELLSDAKELAGQSGLLVKLASVASDRLSVDPSSLKTNTTLPAPDGTALHPKVRRWDQSENDVTTLSMGAVPIRETANTPPIASDWISLEDAVQIRFSPGATYQVGDYWLFPARVATGRLEWPTHLESGVEVPDLRKPRGIRHHYAPLGILFADSTAGDIQQCRTCLQLGPAECANAPTSTPAPAPVAPPAAGAAVRAPAAPAQPAAVPPSAKTVTKKRTG